MKPAEALRFDEVFNWPENSAGAGAITRSRVIHFKEALNKSAAVSGSFAAIFRFEDLEIHKGFLRFSNLNLRQNLSLTALAIDSELP